MTATDRAMASEEWNRIADLEDRVVILDALIGTLRDRIRELEAEIDRLKREPLTAAATAYWNAKVIALRAENELLRAALDKSAHALAIAGVWIVESDRNARIRRAEREALDALTTALGTDEKGETDAGAL